MNLQATTPQPAETRAARSPDRPRYVTPHIQAMSEKEILTTFQITQSMGTWWTNGVVTPCT